MLQGYTKDPYIDTSPGSTDILKAHIFYTDIMSSLDLLDSEDEYPVSDKKKIYIYLPARGGAQQLCMAALIKDRFSSKLYPT